MARYTGPKSKISRRFAEPIFGASKALQKKAYPPGMHGRGRRKKQSEYAVQLMEKQKVKYLYGMLEKQFENLTVNGEIVNISSYSLKPGDIVAVREKSKSLEAITNSLSARNARQFSWLEWDGKEMAGKFISAPSRDLIPEKIQEQLIVELYSK